MICKALGYGHYIHLIYPEHLFQVFTIISALQMGMLRSQEVCTCLHHTADEGWGRFQPRLTSGRVRFLDANCKQIKLMIWASFSELSLKLSLSSVHWDPVFLFEVGISNAKDSLGSKTCGQRKLIAPGSWWIGLTIAYFPPGVPVF